MVHLTDSTRTFGDQVFSDYSERAVQFEKITHWLEDEENTITYKITQEIPKTKNDWIGVYKVILIKNSYTKT